MKSPICMCVSEILSNGASIAVFSQISINIMLNAIGWHLPDECDFSVAINGITSNQLKEMSHQKYFYTQNFVVKLETAIVPPSI